MKDPRYKQEYLYEIPKRSSKGNGDENDKPLEVRGHRQLCLINYLL